MVMPGHSFSGPLGDPTSLETRLETQLREHVTVLAEDIGGRSVQLYSSLQEAEAYLIRELTEIGFEVARQEYRLETGEKVANLEAVVPGMEHEDTSIVIGAHYDSVESCPGANDNASGVAATIELARLFREKPAKTTLRFAFFVNEEPPYFQTDEMGSVVYARALKQSGKKILGMLALETMGYFSDEPGSQQYPFPFSAFYPDTGNFIGFVSNLSSRSFLKKFLRSFRAGARIPSEGVASPSMVPGIAWSDHASFWDIGVPAIMVTDTAPFRYPHYHKLSDTPEKLDYGRLARVVSGLEAAIRNL